MATVSRNAPCPCGSGKKHKRCCMGKVVVSGRSKALLAGLAVAVLGAAGTVGYFYGVGTGVGVAVVGIVAAGIVYVIGKPPPPSGRGGASNIDFGTRR